MFQGSATVAVSAFHFFLCLNNIPLYGYTTFCLTIHQLITIWIVLAIINSFSINIYAQICVWTCVFFLSFFFSFFLSFFFFGIYLGMELLGHMIALFLTMWERMRLSSKEAAPFYIPTVSTWGFQFLCSIARWGRQWRWVKEESAGGFR